MKELSDFYSAINKFVTNYLIYLFISRVHILLFYNALKYISYSCTWNNIRWMNIRLALKMKQETWIGNMNPYKNCRFNFQFLIEAGNASIFSITKHAIHSFLKWFTKTICIFIKANLINVETFFQSWNI